MNPKKQEKTDQPFVLSFYSIQVKQTYPGLLMLNFIRRLIKALITRRLHKSPSLLLSLLMNVWQFKIVNANVWLKCLSRESLWIGQELILFMFNPITTNKIILFQIHLCSFCPEGWFNKYFRSSNVSLYL